MAQRIATGVVVVLLAVGVYALASSSDEDAPAPAPSDPTPDAAKADDDADAEQKAREIPKAVEDLIGARFELVTSADCDAFERKKYEFRVGPAQDFADFPTAFCNVELTGKTVVFMKLPGEPWFQAPPEVRFPLKHRETSNPSS